jgi:hypothetical protein
LRRCRTSVHPSGERKHDGFSMNETTVVEFRAHVCGSPVPQAAITRPVPVGNEHCTRITHLERHAHRARATNGAREQNEKAAGAEARAARRAP